LRNERLENNNKPHLSMALATASLNHWVNADLAL